jgi:hypothetical protein
MEYNLENVKILVRKMRNKKDSTLRLKDKALRNYYTHYKNIEEDKREQSLHILFPKPMFDVLCRKYIYDEVI